MVAGICIRYCAEETLCGSCHRVVGSLAEEVDGMGIVLVEHQGSLHLKWNLESGKSPIFKIFHIFFLT